MLIQNQGDDHISILFCMYNLWQKILVVSIIFSLFKHSFSFFFSLGLGLDN